MLVEEKALFSNIRSRLFKQ